MSKRARNAIISLAIFICTFGPISFWASQAEDSDQSYARFEWSMSWLLGVSIVWGVGAMIWDVWHWPRWKQQKEIKQQRKRKENEHAQRYSSPTLPATTVTMDIPTQIRKFAELRDQGLITEDEFQEQKTKLLSYFQK